jgi:hypothetical protein
MVPRKGNAKDFFKISILPPILGCWPKIVQRYQRINAGGDKYWRRKSRKPA